MLAMERPAVAPEAQVPPAGRPLWLHLLAYGALLLAFAPFARLGTTFTSDEGAYALQARTLHDGTWAYEYKAADLDPERRWVPVVKADLSERGTIHPYARHPAYPRALQGSTALFGERVGLYVWSLLGALLLAAAAWKLASEVAPGAERWAFWVAAASPVTFNAYLVWAHSPSAALGGWAVVFAVRVLRRGPTIAVSAGLVGCLVGGALLRSEGLLFAIAVGIAAAAAVARARGFARGAATAVLALGPVAAAVAIETAWQRALFGQGYTQVTGRRSGESFLSGRISGAWHELFAGAAGDRRAAFVVLVALGLVVAAAILPRRRAVLLAAAATLYVVRLLVQDGEPITGLLAAWPVALVGLVLLPRRRLRQLPVATIAGSTLLFVGAVLATQYAEGGGWEWGGRFFSPALAPLAVLAALGLRAVRPPRRAVVGLGVAPMLLGLAVLVSVRSSTATFADGVERAIGEAPLAVTTVEHLPRIMWGHDERITWMMTPKEDLGALLDDLADSGAVRELVLVTSAAVDRAAVEERFRVADDVTGAAVAERGAVALRLVER